MNTGRSPFVGRSKCTHCGKLLKWYELVPVFSFLFLRGRCKVCKKDISFQYPIVELITGLVFVLLYTQTVILGTYSSFLNITSFVFGCIMTSLLMVIVVYDLRHKIIPDKVVYPFILLSLLAILFKAFFLPGFFPGIEIVDGVVVGLPFFLLWAISKGQLMGFGDVKLALGLGWLLGLNRGFTAVILAFWIGGIVGIFLLSVGRRYSLKSQIPFAPFLIAGLAIVVLFGVTFQTIFPVWP